MSRTRDLVGCGSQIILPISYELYTLAKIRSKGQGDRGQHPDSRCETGLRSLVCYLLIVCHLRKKLQWLAKGVSWKRRSHRKSVEGSKLHLRWGDVLDGRALGFKQTLCQIARKRGCPSNGPAKRIEKR